LSQGAQFGLFLKVCERHLDTSDVWICWICLDSITEKPSRVNVVFQCLDGRIHTIE
jgi:hypothetical protein